VKKGFEKYERKGLDQGDLRLDSGNLFAVSKPVLGYAFRPKGATLDFIDFLQKEWPIVSGAPFTVATLCAISALGAYKAASWKHGSTIEHLKERMTGKDEELNRYRELVELIPANGSLYSRMTHVELQKAILLFVSSLRNWLGTIKIQSDKRNHKQFLERRKKTTQLDSKQAWESEIEYSTRSSTAFSNEYDAKFKVRALVLRDELLKRVTHLGRDDIAHRSYAYPTSTLSAAMIADDLEKMARQLD
jgi:hypothetical protein